MSQTRRKEVSHLLSLVLRHKPEHLGLQLDEHGYVAVSDLLAALARHGKAIERADLDWIVAENNKQRFGFSTDGTRIRANQGHSLPVDLGLTPIAPPEILFHGTAKTKVAQILEQGLRAQSRHHVHLSADVNTAIQVGQRHGKPVLLQVAAAALHRAGHVFYQSDNGVWLTDQVPASALRLTEHQP